MLSAHRVLVLGACNYSGYHLAERLAPEFRVFGSYHGFPVSIDGVITFPLTLSGDMQWLEKLERLKPDSVFYAVGERDETRCRSDWSGSQFLNAQAAHATAEKLGEWGGRLFYLSSTKVFSGESGNYREDSPTDPVSQYGESVAKAEERLLELENTYVLRMGKLFGLSMPTRACMFHDLLESLWAQTPHLYIGDEYRSFLSTEFLGKAVSALLCAEELKHRTYHLAHSGPASYYAFAVKTARAFGFPHGVINAQSGAPITERGFNAKLRGRDRSLASTHFESDTGFRLGSLDHALSLVREALDTWGSFPIAPEATIF